MFGCQDPLILLDDDRPIGLLRIRRTEHHRVVRAIGQNTHGERVQRLALDQYLFGTGEAGIEQAVEIYLRFFAGAVSPGFRARLLSIRGRQGDTAFSAILRE